MTLNNSIYQLWLGGRAWIIAFFTCSVQYFMIKDTIKQADVMISPSTPDPVGLPNYNGWLMLCDSVFKDMDHWGLITLSK